LPLFDPPIDLSFIASRFERLEKHEPLWLSVSIFDSHLERVYSSKHLPQAKAFEPDSIREAFFTKKTNIGSISQGPNGWGIPIRVPVIREGVVVYVLSVIIGTDELSNLLADVNIPEHWFGVVADKDGLIVARNHNIDQTIGKYLSKPSLDFCLSDFTEDRVVCSFRCSLSRISAAYGGIKESNRSWDIVDEFINNGVCDVAPQRN
jgi:hypothetical protein